MVKSLSRYNPWWETGKIWEDDRKELLYRSKYMNPLLESVDSKMITFLTGLRRIGKTSLMYLVIEKLLQDGVDSKHLFYVSLDDYLLADYSIIEIVEQYRTFNKIPFKDKIYLFLDEIVSKEDFEIQLKNLYDLHNVNIVASASSASILGEKQHLLTGRSKLIEILPLDFNEYLVFKKIEISPSDDNLRSQYFKEYMQTGGIPEYVKKGEDAYLQELVDDIIYKDIAVVYKIKDVQVLKDLFLLLMERAGKQVSLNKITKILNISPDSARRYFDMFVRTYLIHPVVRFGKTNERILSPKKIYAADLGIKNIFTGFRDIGAIFENYVYLHLKHKKPMYYYEKGNEIDFVLGKDTLIEVKYNRELEGKQLKAFDKANFDYKHIIKNLKDIETFRIVT